MSYQNQPLSGDRYIDGMLQGSYWTTDPLVISISEGWSGERWNNPDYMANQFVTATYEMTRYTALDGRWAGLFSDPEKAYQAGSDLNLTIDSNNLAFSANTAWARGFFPNTQPEIHAGDIYINTRSDANALPSYAPGSQGYFLLLHELGHALGLKHPHDDGGSGRPTFTELEIEEWDFDLFTVMSYNDTNFDLVRYNPATPMILDVFALQHLYGVNTTRHAGDTTWQLSQTEHYETVFDPSGTNELRLGASDAGWYVQLPDQTIGQTPTPVGWSHVQNGDGLPQTFYWLAGDYQKVTGSARSDEIVGNAGDNQINGGLGDDILRGGAGDDVFDVISGLPSANGADWMYGGSGDDVFVIDTPLDRVIELPNAGVDTLRVVHTSPVTVPDHVERVDLTRLQSIDTVGNASDNTFTVSQLSGQISGQGGTDWLSYENTSQSIHLSLESAQTISVALASSATGQSGASLTLNDIEWFEWGESESIHLAELTKPYALPEATIERLISLYFAYFDRLPDASGLRYWLNRAHDGMAVESIAESFYQQPESRALDTLDNKQLITQAYQQLFDRDPDPGGRDYWLNDLDTGTVTRPHFLLSLSDAALSTTGDSRDSERIADLITLGSTAALELGLDDQAKARQTIIDYGAGVTTTELATDLQTTFASNATDSSARLIITYDNLFSV